LAVNGKPVKKEIILWLIRANRINKNIGFPKSRKAKGKK
jgi:hypothetical protein